MSIRRCSVRRMGTTATGFHRRDRRPHPGRNISLMWKETAMKAVRYNEPKGFEGIDGLVYEDAPDPQPAIGDALVQVRAASFTPTELMWPLSTDRAGHDR